MALGLEAPAYQRQASAQVQTSDGDYLDGMSRDEKLALGFEALAYQRQASAQVQTFDVDDGDGIGSSAVAIARGGALRV